MLGAVRPDARGRLRPVPARARLGGARNAWSREVSFRPLASAEIERYVAAGEWEGRAGAYAIQGLGASLVERVDGDYLNVVGLPPPCSSSILAERFPGAYGFG